MTKLIIFDLDGTIFEPIDFWRELHEVYGTAKENKVLVEGVNMKIIHQRPGKNIQKGQKIEKAAPLHISNIMILDPKTKKPTRVKFVMEKGKKVRVAIKSGSKLQ